jgi:hypothetical protein
VESYHAFLHGADNSHLKIDCHFLYSKNSTPYALYGRDNDEKDGRPLKSNHDIIFFTFSDKSSPYAGAFPGF